MLVPGGFGMRGIEGKIEAIRYARNEDIPFFGICLGMQCAVIEFARNVLGLEDANSTEFERTRKPRDRADGRAAAASASAVARCGLGAMPCVLSPGSLAHKAYAVEFDPRTAPASVRIQQRLSQSVQEKGLVATGVSPDGTICRDHGAA